MSTHSPFKISFSVICKHKEQRFWLFRERSRFNPIGDVIVRLRTESFFAI